MYAVQIPDGVSAGQQFQVNVGGQLMSVPVPAGYGHGMTINVQAPPQVAPTPVMGAPVAPLAQRQAQTETGAARARPTKAARTAP